MHADRLGLTIISRAGAINKSNNNAIAMARLIKMPKWALGKKSDVAMHENPPIKMIEVITILLPTVFSVCRVAVSNGIP